MVSFEQIVPIIFRENNVLVNRNGDITFCFRCRGPEMCSINRERLSRLTYNFGVGMTFLPDGTVLHKQDIFLKKKLSVRHEEEKDYLSKAYLQLYDGQEYLSQESYLYITKTALLSLNRTYNAGLTGGDIQDEAVRKAYDKRAVSQRQNIDELESALQGYQKFMGDSGIEVVPLTEEETDRVIENYYRLYDEDFVGDIDFLNKEVGFKKFEIVSVNDDEQMPNYLRAYRLHPEYSRYSKEIRAERGSRTIGLYSDYFCAVGYHLDHEHIVNQLFYYDGKEYWNGEIERRRKNSHAWRFFGADNGLTADALLEFQGATLQHSESVIRSHFNVMVWTESEKETKALKETLRSRLKELGVTAKVAGKEDVRMLFLASAPGNAGTMAVEETFIGHASALSAMALKETVTTSPIDKDKTGLLFTDRQSGALIQRDCWFEPYKMKKITNRNFLGIGKTGSGKSSMTIEVIRQYLAMDFNCTVLDIGRSFEVLAKSHGGNYIIYEDGLGLGVNPFAFKGNAMSNSLLEFLAQFTSVLWKPNNILNDDEMSALEKVILAAYKGRRDASKASGFIVEGDYSRSTVGHLFEFVESNRQEVEDLIKGNKNFFDIDSFLLSVEKFVEGKFDRLFTDNNNIDDTKNLTVWELDNVKDHKTLFPILSMLITYLTTEVIWKRTTQEKIVLIEEAWKMLEKPSMASYVKWLYKTIRKFDGAVGINIQQAGDIVVPGTNIKETILANSDVKFIMSHTVPMAKDLAEIFDWTDEQHALLLSIPLDEEKSKGQKRFSELISVVGSDMKALRLQVSPEQIINFTSEMKEKEKLFALVERHQGNWERAIKEYTMLYNI